MVRKLNIVININSKYLFPARTMLFSLAENCKEELNVFCLHRDLSQKEIDGLGKFITQKCHGKLNAINMGEKYSDMQSTIPHISIEAYFRLDAVHMLPDSVDRFLYLDCDLIVNGDITEFYHQSFDGNLIVACPDLGIVNEDYLNNLKQRDFHFADGHIYFNSGVILFNAEKIRHTFTIEDIHSYVERYKDKLIYMDQDLLNVIYTGKIKYADGNIYNFQSHPYVEIGLDDIREKNIVLVHFCHHVKPWNYRRFSKSKWLFWKYAKNVGGISKGKYLLFRAFNPICSFIWKNVRELYVKIFDS